MNWWLLAILDGLAGFGYIKAAIRYLRANARQWHVDPDRLGIWGTSSGGNTSLLVGLTADDPRYGIWQPVAGNRIIMPHQSLSGALTTQSNRPTMPSCR